MLLSACSNKESNGPVNQVTATETTIDIDKKVLPDEISNDKQNDSIIEFIILLNEYFYEADLKEFKKFIDEYGMYSIIYFDDGRDENKAILAYKDTVGKGLMLVSSQSGKAGICLSFGPFIQEIKKIYINDYIVQENPLKNIDWFIQDEYIIQNQLSDILQGCQELILKNNEYIPQIFRLSDTTYAFSFSSIDEKALERFYGYWIIFDRVNDSYVIRAIIELQ